MSGGMRHALPLPLTLDKLLSRFRAPPLLRCDFAVRSEAAGCSCAHFPPSGAPSRVASQSHLVYHMPTLREYQRLLTAKAVICREVATVDSRR